MGPVSRRSAILSSFACLASLQSRTFAFAEELEPKTVRIIVCLADNRNQGIVPISAQLGNGQDPKNNLYWGALYGVKSYFSRHADWEKIASEVERGPHQLDYIEFQLKDTTTPVSIKAEAWDGAHMDKAISRFYGLLSDRSSAEDLIVFVGHNGLMDMFIVKPVVTAATKSYNLERDRKAIILACNSSQYFETTLHDIGVEPYVLTQGLMAPEAYSLEAAIKSWARGGSAHDARLAAAKSYARFQKIPEKNARWLFKAN